MEELLIFKDAKTGDKVGIYYNIWLFIIKCIIIKYAHKTSNEADDILKKFIIRSRKVIMLLSVWVMKQNIIGQCWEFMVNNIGLKVSVPKHQ